MSEQLKIAVVCFTGNSGLTDYSVSLCKELVKHADVTLLTAKSYDETQYRVNLPSAKLFNRTRHYPFDIIRFVLYVLRHKPDVLLFESWIKYPAFEWLLVWIFKLAGIRTALTIHDLLPHYPKPWSKWVLSYYYRCFDRLIVHSKRTEDGLNAMGVKTQPLIVPHGLYEIFNLDKLTREAILPNFPQVNTRDFVVLFFGHIETRKGILEYLSASELLAKEDNIKFVVAGGNSLSGSAAVTLDSYRNKKNVVMHDQSIPMEQVQHYFTLAHVVILPYLEGTTSGVVKLAMAFDRPIIASDVGDFAETLHDWSGLLIKLDTLPENLAAAITGMRTSYSNFMMSLNENKQKYQWDRIAIQHIEYLR
ncbi:glycosyltransferase [Methylophilaceae bacterium 11]|uniref:glycosyltransferase n=1 Tax=Methylotenera sp. 1P/1 TaxID=1131551 RepID=UPI000375F50C|nr:glycosyltransferase [Methylotenera sp. 1P/1]EUJ11295.1 glycosyltransferase [Methylophilaceae bacterium 11]